MVSAPAPSATVTTAVPVLPTAHPAEAAPAVGGSGLVDDDWFDYPCPLPDFENIRWEKRTDKRGWVVQYAPDGAAPISVVGFALGDALNAQATKMLNQGFQVNEQMLV